MKGVSNEGQFKKARKEMPDFFKDSSSAKNDKSNVMDKANPAALRLANGGSARQPRNGKMQFASGGRADPEAIEFSGEELDDIERTHRSFKNDRNAELRPHAGTIAKAVASTNQRDKGKSRDAAHDAGEVISDRLEAKGKYARGGFPKKPVKRNMGGVLPPVVDGVEQMMGKPQNPPALGLVKRSGLGQMARPGLGRMGPPGMAAPPVPTMGGPDPMEMAGPMQQVGGEGPGFKRGGAVPRNKMGRHSMKEDAADKKADAISAKKRGMTPAAFEGTKADEKMDRAGAPPFRRGGAPIKRAMGGIGKARHDEASYEGKPKAAPKGKKLFEAI